MQLYLRLLMTLLTFRRRGSAAPLDMTAMGFRVRPSDLDLFGHVTNGRFPMLMDVARMDFLGRTGLLKVILRERWTPVICGTHIEFKRSLKLFQRYRIETRVLGWDDRAVVMEHAFMRGGELCARGLTQALFVGRCGKVPMDTVIEAFDAGPRLPLPTGIAALFEAPTRVPIAPVPLALHTTDEEPEEFVMHERAA